MRARGLALFGLLGCAGAGPTPPGDPPEDDSEVATDTDPGPTGDTAPPASSAPAPPEDWGAGLVDLSAPWLTTLTFPVDPGRREPFQGPQGAPGFFADLDGDGALDVVVGSEANGFTKTVRAFSWDGVALAHEAAWSTELATPRDVPIGGLDLDGDGHTDLLHLGLEPLVRWGVGGATWDGALSWQGADAEQWEFRGAVQPYDLDRDGWLDLAVGEQGCTDNVVWFHRTGARAYTQRRDLQDQAAPRVRVDSVLVWPSPLGDQVVLIGTGCDRSDPHPGFERVVRRDGDGWPVLEAHDPTPADTVWRRDPITNGGPFTLAMPMGSAVGDLDGDGVLDLLLALSNDLLTVLQGRPDGTFVDRSVDAGISFVWFEGERRRSDFPWSIALPDLDQDGRSDIVVTVGDDATSFLMLDGHPMRSQVWWNGGDFRFHDVSGPIGVDHVGSWHALGIDDLDADGDADLILGGQGHPPRALHNRVEVGHHGISLSLRGTTSSHLGQGAIVEVEVTGLPRQTHLAGNVGNPYSPTAPVVFAGLGTATRADRVRVRWPSGLVQEVTDLEGDRHHVVVEPSLLEVAPATRHLPADGVSAATIRVTPRAVDGAARAATVSVVLHGAPATLAGVVQEGDAWVATVVAPTSPGSTAVEVRVDGAPAGVWPRLWWDAL